MIPLIVCNDLDDDDLKKAVELAVTGQQKILVNDVQQ